MQLGFVIDHSRCIGCHACTVACKAENDVPVGRFRTWVKYTERGQFPSVRRSFAVLRCNQCTDAPCVRICPVRALDKRPDGIVDVDPAACIGCKACMQGCPYDALYLNDASGTAEKCHFCAHRTEIGLAPACAVVCPTEAIVPGDFHDPQSAVSRLMQDYALEARKTEAGTGPNVFYREADAAGLDPLATAVSGGYLWANRMPGVALDAEAFDATHAEAERRARTTYDADHPAWWGWRVSAYLLTKSLAAGLFIVLGLLALGTGAARTPAAAPVLAGGALLFLAATSVLLIADLKRPGRFLFILIRPNLDSWLTRGSFVLMGYGAVLTIGTVVWSVGSTPEETLVLLVLGLVLAALTAGYTGWLFGQASGRVLWMRRGLWLHLIVQAAIAGGAASLLAAPWLQLNAADRASVRQMLVAALVLHGLFALTEHWMAPRGRRPEFRRAARLLTHGPYARRHWWLGLGAGVVLPILLVALESTLAGAAGGGLALFGLYTEEDILVRAGQALPIS